MDLNTAWFCLLGILFVVYALLDGFDLGVGIIHLFTRDRSQRLLHFRAVKPVWDGNEVWLITSGAALFAAFPAVYAAVFSGFYLAFLLLLLALIFRAISIEFVEKIDSQGWRTAWDWSFGVSSLVASLLFGVAVGNILRGIPINREGYFEGTFLGLLNPFALLVGVLVVVMFVMHGAAWMLSKSEGAVQARMRLWVLGAWGLFLPLHLLATAYSRAASPFLFEGVFQKPGFWVFLGLLLAGAVTLPLWVAKRRNALAFAASSLVIVGASALGGLSLFPLLVPSSIDAAHNSLSVYGSSSSPLTLKVMLIIVAIGMPFVLIYTAAVHWIFWGKVKAERESEYLNMQAGFYELSFAFESVLRG